MTTSQLSAVSVTARVPERRRHTVRLRQLEVQSVIQLSSSISRVTLVGTELEGFFSPGFDDHVKMFFPAPGEKTPLLPTVGPDGLKMPEGSAMPIGRDYTPRSYDRTAGRMEIDFALHHDGPASSWARTVKPGDHAWIAGPRVSFIYPVNFDWHLLIADETGVPALARRLEELPATARVLALIEVDGEEDRIPLAMPADARISWVYRGGTPAGEARVLVDALRSCSFPEGDFFTWIACESRIAKELRGILVSERNANPKWTRAFGYWRLGVTGVHDEFHD